MLYFIHLFWCIHVGRATVGCFVLLCPKQLYPSPVTSLHALQFCFLLLFMSLTTVGSCLRKTSLFFIPPVELPLVIYFSDHQLSRVTKLKQIWNVGIYPQLWTFVLCNCRLYCACTRILTLTLALSMGNWAHYTVLFCFIKMPIEHNYKHNLYSIIEHYLIAQWSNKFHRLDL